jgi:hypothetical protein
VVYIVLTVGAFHGGTGGLYRRRNSIYGLDGPRIPPLDRTLPEMDFDSHSSAFEQPRLRATQSYSYGRYRDNCTDSMNDRLWPRAA